MKPQSDTNIYPTGHCFDDALDLMVEMLKAQEEPGGDQTLHLRLRLVHGVCTFEDGHDYAHAWVEDIEERKAYFTGIHNGERQYFVVEPASDYHEHLRVKDFVRYSYRQALTLNRLSAHYGPWVPHLRALCRPHHDPFDDRVAQEE